MDFIIKNIDNAYEHIANSFLIYLYNYVRTYYDENNEDQLLEGKIEVNRGYQSMVNYLQNKFPHLYIMISRIEYLKFEDEVPKTYLANTLGDGLGVIATDLSDITLSYANTNLSLPANTTKFNELKYFTTITRLGNNSNDTTPFQMLQECKESLEEIDLRNITRLDYNTFNGFINLKTINNTDNITYLANTNFKNSAIEYIKLENVTNVGNANFQDCTSLKTALIDGPETKIRDLMFDGCTSLETVRGYSNVDAIWQYAFRNCTSLTTLDIPFTNITSLSKYCLENCYALDWDDPNMDFSNVTSFGECAFYNSGLKHITFTNQPFTMGASCFYKAKYLETLILPNNLTTEIKNLGACVRECTSLTTLSLPTNQSNFKIPSHFAHDASSLVTINGMENCNYIYNESFINDTALKNIDLSSVEVFEGSSFRNTGLEEIDLSNCYQINDNAFYDCKYLYKIENTDNVITLKSSAFKNVGTLSENDMTHIYLPKVLSLQQSTFENSAITTIEFRDLTSISTQIVFKNCSKLTSITGLYNVTNVGANVFQGCTSLENISLPVCTSLGGDTFYGCTNLKNVSIPSLTTLTSRQFCNCTKLNNVDLRGVTSISGSVFEGANIVNLDIRNCETISSNQFQNKTNFTTLNVSSLQTGARYMFMGCTSLTTVDLPSMTALPQDGFRNCSNLTTVNISNVCTEVGQSCFNTCTKLTTINTSYFETIRGWAFENCTLLTTVDISNATTILEAPFKNCQSLTGNIVLNAAITSIPKQCFYGCKLLTSLTILSPTVATWGSECIDRSVNFPIYVPDALVDSYKATTTWKDTDLAARIKPLSQKPS